MNSFSNVVLATDLSDTARAAAEMAARIVRVAGGHLHLVHVRLPMVDPYGLSGFVPPNADETLEGHLRERMQALCDALSVDSGFELINDPSIADAVVAAADGRQAQLIVVGTHGRKGLSRMFLGSVAADVARTAHTPVLVVPPREAPSPEIRRVLVAVDFSRAARAALDEAVAIARAHGATLLALHVVDDAELPPYFADSVRRDVAEIALDHLGQQLSGIAPDVETEPLVITGSPHAAITDTAGQRDVDLIVVGASGLSGLQRFLLGSVAERVLRSAPCPVLVHRGAVTAL